MHLTYSRINFKLASCEHQEQHKTRSLGFSHWLHRPWMSLHAMKFIFSESAFWQLWSVKFSVTILVCPKWLLETEIAAVQKVCQKKKFRSQLLGLLEDNDPPMQQWSSTAHFINSGLEQSHCQCKPVGGICISASSCSLAKLQGFALAPGSHSQRCRTPSRMGI